MSQDSIQNYIDGKWIVPVTGKYLDLYDPAIGKVYAQVPDSGSEDIAFAVEAASRAFASWSTTPSEERSKILRKIAEGIEKNLEKLAHAESVDNGKPVTLARNMDIPRAAQNFSFFADAITQVASETHHQQLGDGSALNYTRRDPIGVVGCISPWNLPLYLLTWKIAPALASGCTVVAKPSEITPMTAYLLTKVCHEAGLPEGVLNIVHGTGQHAGAALVSHPQVHAVSFTGSTRTGAEIARVTAPQFKKLSLEMGGKNANIVFADCDFEEALQGTLRSSFLNQGQICLCGSRIFIERPIYEKFKSALIEKTLKLKQGDPLVAETEQGALVSKDHFDKVMSYIELARAEGGKILTGGRAFKGDSSWSSRCAQGWFIEPTLIEGLSSSCRVNQEEVFGPVATLIPFDSEEEVLNSANSTRYGLAASIWTTQLARAHRVASKIQAGVIWINCWMLRDLRTPFGGVKDSGVGREGGLEALRFFTETRNICIKMKDSK
jgi:aminomuconate-semialdehyde/2-hydroxymuconate-6-semialdehyde dehydrogenase